MYRHCATENDAVPYISRCCVLTDSTIGKGLPVAPEG